MTRNILLNVIKKLINICKKNEIKIVFMGGIATNIWARPRATYDIDGIISLPEVKFKKFIFTAEKSGFRCVPKHRIKSIRDMQFITLLNPYYKIYVDLFIAQEEFQMQVINRAKKIKFDKIEIMVVSPEDLILYKLQSGRNKDMEDVRNILTDNYNRLNFKYLNAWADRLGVRIFLQDELKSLRFNKSGYYS